jgi:endonuclease/exonuclease/phosphatase family metal-dependent hydrolase
MILSFGFTQAAAGEGPSMVDGPVGNLVKIRVMTFNIRFGKGWDGQWDLQRTAGVIRDADPDLVGIQEVDREWSSRSQFKDVVTELSERLGMFYTFAPSMDKAPGMPGEKFGNAILSKYPLDEVWSRLLPADGMGRGMVGARLRIDGVPICFFTTHLGLSTSDRLKQVDEILKTLEEVPGPTIITGDWNVNDQGEEVAAMTQVFQDAQMVAGKPEVGTFYLKDGSRERIDYIFASPEFGVESVDVLEAIASDHLPVIANLNLRLTDETGRK